MHIARLQLLLNLVVDLILIDVEFLGCEGRVAVDVQVRIDEDASTKFELCGGAFSG